MSKWEQHGVQDRVLDALGAVHIANQPHAFGRPFMTAYQLVIKMEQAEPGLCEAMGYVIGGAGTGHLSFARYLANQLSSRISRGDPIADEVEGAFLTNNDVRGLIYDGPTGPITSTLTGSGYDLSMFRLRTPV
jgi:hypothetical protein